VRPIIILSQVCVKMIGSYSVEEYGCLKEKEPVYHRLFLFPIGKLLPSFISTMSLARLGRTIYCAELRSQLSLDQGQGQYTSSFFFQLDLRCTGIHRQSYGGFVGFLEFIEFVELGGFIGLRVVR